VKLWTGLNWFRIASCGGLCQHSNEPPGNILHLEVFSSLIIIEFLGRNLNVHEHEKGNNIISF
jgi:hypothetical protein